MSCKIARRTAPSAPFPLRQSLEPPLFPLGLASLTLQVDQFVHRSSLVTMFWHTYMRLFRSFTKPGVELMPHAMQPERDPHMPSTQELVVVARPQMSAPPPPSIALRSRAEADRAGATAADAPERRSPKSHPCWDDGKLPALSKATVYEGTRKIMSLCFAIAPRDRLLLSYLRRGSAGRDIASRNNSRGETARYARTLHQAVAKTYDGLYGGGINSRRPIELGQREKPKGGKT